MRKVATAIALSFCFASAAAHAGKITECVPMGLRDGAVQIYVLCNAANVNARWNLTVDPRSSCAVNWQKVSREGSEGQVLQQGSFTRPLGEGYPAPLRACTDEEAISF